MKLWFNLLCRDIDAQLAFYQSVLGLPEAVASRSPIYRALETAAFQLGFNAWPAYGLLNLAGREPGDGPLPVSGYPTWMVDGVEAVDQAVTRALTAGGRLLKPAYATYYGQWQAVLEDPEGHVFRVAAPGLPAGLAAPPLALATREGPTGPA